MLTQKGRSQVPGSLIMRKYDVPDSFDSIQCHIVGSLDDIPTNERDKSKVTFQEFNLVRNLLVSGLEKYGSVGPFKEFFIASIDQDDPVILVTKEESAIYVVSDQLYETYRYQAIEFDEQQLTKALINTVWRTLWSYPAWGIKISTPDRYIYVTIESIYIHRNGLSAQLCDISDMFSS